MYRKNKMKKYLSVVLSIAIIGSSFGLTGYAQVPVKPDTVYHGKLICNLEEHSHSEDCYREASSSDAKKEETYCGYKEHSHNANCYKVGDPVTEEPQEKPTIEMPEIKPSEPETVQPESAEETAEMEFRSKASPDYGQVGFWTPGRYPDQQVHVSTFEELESAVEEVNTKKQYYWIILEDDIEWNKSITINTAILININGHTINITTSPALIIEQSINSCIKGPGNIIIKGLALENPTSKKNLITLRRTKDSSSTDSSTRLTIDGTPYDGGLTITSEDSGWNPVLIKNSGRCYLSNLQVKDYSVHGSLIEMDYPDHLYGAGYFTVNACSFQGVNSDGDGAILHVGTDQKNSGRAHIIELNSSTFTENHAVNGGVAYMQASEVHFTVFDGHFQNNSAQKNGGVFNKNDDIGIKLDGVDNLFEHNTAGGNGGAIYHKYGQVYGKLGTFKNNTAQNGGAIYAKSCAFTGEAEFIRNHAIKKEGDTDGTTGNGGALYTTGILSIKGGTFSENTADTDGGAVYTSGQLILNSMESSGNMFSVNTASRNGGAAYAATLEMNEGNFSGNTAAGDGGALYAVGEAVINNGNFEKNTTTRIDGNPGSGGAIYANDKLTIYDITCTENTASRDGSALYAIGDLTVLGGKFIKNKAGMTGTIYSDSKSIFKPEKQITISENTAQANAGIEGKEVTLYDVVATQNIGFELYDYMGPCVYCFNIKMENGRSPAIFDNFCITDFNSSSLTRAKDIDTDSSGLINPDVEGTVCGTMLGEGSANWYYEDIKNNCTLGPINKDSGTIIIPNHWCRWYSEPSEQDKENALKVSPCVLMTKNHSDRGIASTLFAYTVIFITSEIDPSTGDNPEETTPEETTPEETLPEESSPEETSPTESTPEESSPEESTPEESSPEETTPEESSPEESTPEESSPEETTPEESSSEETLPVESIPEETLPVESTPEETLPTESAPETLPVESATTSTTPEETSSAPTVGSSRKHSGRRNSISDFPVMSTNTVSGQEIRITSPSYVGTGSWQANLTHTSWKLQKPDGSYAVSEWGYIDNFWYLFDADGYTCTGWQKVNGEWYYFQPNAVMKTDWIILDDKWYYLDESGAMKKGWVFLNGKWYFLGEDGAMLANTRTPDGYIVDEKGEWKPDKH